MINHSYYTHIKWDMQWGELLVAACDLSSKIYGVQAKFESIGSPHWKLPELFFEKKGLIPSLQQLLAKCL